MRAKILVAAWVVVMLVWGLLIIICAALRCPRCGGYHHPDQDCNN